MKIGIYSPYLDTLTGGEKYIFTMASCLSLEHEVTIFWDDFTILDEASKKFGLELSKVKVLPNILRNKGFLGKFIDTLTYDRFIFLSDGSIPLLGAKKLFIHFQFPVEWANTSSLAFQIKKMFISKIICNSYYTKHYIDKKLGINSIVLHPPAEVKLKESLEKENTILTVGRFNRLTNGSDFKKLEEMVKAFKQFQKKRLKGWVFKIATSVRPQEEVEFAKFEKMLNSSSIKIYKNASYKEINDLYKEAKIYWHAAGFGEDLDKHPERAEHFGISTVEAMASGSVPIVINAGGQKEIVKHNDNGYLWNTTSELIGYTHKIATDHELRKRISERAKETSDNFSKERFCEELNHIIW